MQNYCFVQIAAIPKNRENRLRICAYRIFFVILHRFLRILRIMYKASHKMCDLIAHEEDAIQIISRFGLEMGVGEQTIEQVCEAYHVHTPTFLAIVNYKVFHKRVIPNDIDIPTLQRYLSNAHSYFLEFRLPRLRRALIEAIIPADPTTKIPGLILRCYDEFVEEIRTHIAHENEGLFDEHEHDEHEHALLHRRALHASPHAKKQRDGPDEVELLLDGERPVMRQRGRRAECLEVRDVVEDLPPVVEEEQRRQDVRTHFREQCMVEDRAQQRRAEHGEHDNGTLSKLLDFFQHNSPLWLIVMR